MGTSANEYHEQAGGRVVTEAQAESERQRATNADISAEAKSALTNLLMELAQKECITNIYVSIHSCGVYWLKLIKPLFIFLQSIISSDGIEQLAGWLPRTQSDVLRIDTMTHAKLDKYGQQVMTVLEPFWMKLDGWLCLSGRYGTEQQSHPSFAIFLSIIAVFFSTRTRAH